MTGEQEITLREHFDQRLADMRETVDARLGGTSEQLDDLRRDVRAVRDDNAADHQKVRDAMTTLEKRIGAIEAAVVRIEKNLASVVTWRSLGFALGTAAAVVGAVLGLLHA